MRRRSHVTSTIEQYARQHRCALNGLDQALWDQIRGCRLGVCFRRQVVIGRFIVDFVAPRERLIVEVDGGYHAARESADARRDRKLTRMGYRVLRLDAELIRRDVHAAVDQRRDARGRSHQRARGTALAFLPYPTPGISTSLTPGSGSSAWTRTRDPAVNSRLLWCCPAPFRARSLRLLRASCLPPTSGSGPCSLVLGRSRPARELARGALARRGGGRR